MKPQVRRPGASLVGGCRRWLGEPCQTCVRPSVQGRPRVTTTDWWPSGHAVGAELWATVLVINSHYDEKLFRHSVANDIRESCGGDLPLDHRTIAVVDRGLPEFGQRDARLIAASTAATNRSPRPGMCCSYQSRASTRSISASACSSNGRLTPMVLGAALVDPLEQSLPRHEFGLA
jgi:hypothetical protein